MMIANVKGFLSGYENQRKHSPASCWAFNAARFADSAAASSAFLFFSFATRSASSLAACSFAKRASSASFAKRASSASFAKRASSASFAKRASSASFAKRASSASFAAFSFASRSVSSLAACSSAMRRSSSSFAKRASSASFSAFSLASASKASASLANRAVVSPLSASHHEACTEKTEQKGKRVESG